MLQNGSAVSRRIILASALTAPEKIKPHLRGGMWIYAGKDLNRFYAFKEYLGKDMIQASPAQFREFTISNRHAFVQWTEGVHTRYGHDLTHWLSDTFSSNPYMSDLFLYCMNIVWLKAVLRRHPKEDILFLSESRAMLLMADEIASENNGSEIFKYGFNKERIRFFCKIGRSLLSGYARLLLFFIRYIFAYVYRIRTKYNEMEKVSVIIDTFVFENSFDEDGRFLNKYFSELHECFRDSGTSVGIYPIFHKISFRKFRHIFKSIYQNNTGFILLEDFLKPIDYLIVLATSLKRLSRFEKVQKFSGINVQPLINEMNWIKLNSPGLILSLLIHKLPERLCEKGISPTVYINWSENQTLQKAIISGFHRNFIEVEVMGGKPYFPPLNHLNLFNTNTERIFGFAPDKIRTCGKRLNNIFSIYDKVSYYDVWETSRYDYLRKLINNNHIQPEDITKHKIISIILPYSESISRYILTSSTRAIRNAMDNGWNIRIKVHPTLTKSDSVALLKEYDMHNECIEVTYEEMASLLPKTLAVVSSASSAAIEAICLGIPVISIGMPIGLDFNMIDYLPSSMWRLAFTDDEIDSGLNEWALCHPLAFEERRLIGRKVLIDLFGEDTSKPMQVYMESLDNTRR